MMNTGAKSHRDEEESDTRRELKIFQLAILARRGRHCFNDEADKTMINITLRDINECPDRQEKHASFLTKVRC